MIELTKQETVQLLRRAVEEKGADHVYQPPTHIEDGEEWQESHSYFHGGKPGCLVGHVLSYKGITEEALGSDNADTRVNELFVNRTVWADDDVQAILTKVQDAQDQGKAWGAAVEEGLESA